MASWIVTNQNPTFPVSCTFTDLEDAREFARSEQTNIGGPVRIFPIGEFGPLWLEPVSIDE